MILKKHIHSYFVYFNHTLNLNNNKNNFSFCKLLIYFKEIKFLQIFIKKKLLVLFSKLLKNVN